MVAHYNVRALEIHDRVWDQEHIKEVLNFMSRNNLNVLVLHANNIIDEVVWPARYYGVKTPGNLYENYRIIFKELYRYSARRRYMPLQRRDFLRWVISKAKGRGIKVYLENKELWFPDIVETIHPELRKKGYLCCSEMFWWEFLRTKYEELFADLSGLDGIITSPGSRESKLSISSNRCTCKRCQNLNASEWYYNLIMSIYEPTKNAGKELVVRDFVFDPQSHASLAEAMERLPEDIIFSLKNTPHDFYPTFPNNPQLGRIKRQKIWIEYDVMGQYFGWGIAPSIMVRDIARRLAYGREKGASGILIRTDWEGLPGHSCFDTANIINLYAAAMFSENISTRIKDVYYRWLIDQGFLEEKLSAEQEEICMDWIMGIFESTWDIVRKTLFINDCVFSDSSTFPVSIEHAFWLAEEKNSLRDWDITKAEALNPTKENVQKILDEKDEAWKQYEKIKEQLFLANRGLVNNIYEKLKREFEIYGLYIRGFQLMGKIAILTRYLSHPGNKDELFYNHAHTMLVENLHQLKLYINQLIDFNNRETVSYPVFALLNPERAIVFFEDVSSRIKNEYLIKAH
ncbi:hypothetical protein [Neomoorella humiferrea]|uniref:Uncharacterized protein n=1 Tax=Neomoorella humiferrea TaxID=676965 RepID=A0A2T0AT80_9FIRM|nr:hypothetical protein [Moorella humiferrea]PRR73592.1 hypothetical protein MOHU_11270 [Moorella humiferrea]